METEVGKIMTITVIQKRPNTCVAISTVDETQYVGFSKVCWPDTWDSRNGLHVALGKAAAAMFGIKVPKSGRMDVHLLSDPRPGVETKGERALKEMLEHLYDEQDQVEPDTTESVSSLDHPVRLHIPDHRTMEEKERDEVLSKTIGSTCLPDHRTMAERLTSLGDAALKVAAEEATERWIIKQIKRDLSALRKMVGTLVQKRPA